MIRTSLSFAIILTLSAVVRADYQAPESQTNPKVTVKIGSGMYPADAEDNTTVFQKAIDDVNAKGGGRVLVPTGQYRLSNVTLKSNVHILIQSGTVFRSTAGSTGNMFELKGDPGIENVSVVGPQDRVLVDFTDMESDTRRRLFSVGDCRNFRLANFNVKDNQTRFSSIILTWDGVREGQPMHGRDGLIENFAAKDAHYGYGAIQAHSGENIVFRNILAIGGVAVRLETGLDGMNLSGNGGLFNILVDSVYSKNGQGAMMMQPHTMNHGEIVGRNINADGSEFALYIAKPFVSKRRGESKPLTEGSFKSIKVDGVKAVYRDGPIVTRYLHLRYYPRELHAKISRDDNGPEPGFRGPSIAAAAIMQDDVSNVSVTNVEATGFMYRPDILTPKDLFKGGLKEIGGPAPEKAAKIKKAGGGNKNRGAKGNKRN